MTDVEPKVEGPQTLKNQIHATRKRLTDPDVIALGDEGACQVLEELFPLLTQLINSDGNEKEKEDSEIIKEDYDRTQKEVVYCEHSTRNYAPLYKLTIEHRQSTYQEATESNRESRENYLDKLTWRTLKVKRMNQCQKLWDIAKDLIDPHEDVGNKNLTANKLRGNYNVRND